MVIGFQKLDDEFPEFAEIIEHLAHSDPQFAILFDTYNDLIDELSQFPLPSTEEQKAALAGRQALQSITRSKLLANLRRLSSEAR